MSTGRLSHSLTGHLWDGEETTGRNAVKTASGNMSKIIVPGHRKIQLVSKQTPSGV